MAENGRSIRLEPEVERAFNDSGLPFTGLVNRLLKEFFKVTTEKDQKAERLENMIKKRMNQVGSE